MVATVLTVYGIETLTLFIEVVDVDIKLQQYLPFTVLKPSEYSGRPVTSPKLQQYLPFTVLKHEKLAKLLKDIEVATVLTVYGIETISFEIQIIIQF